MLSLHLAELYGVQVRVLTQAVKRNISRFPEDFMFQLTSDEVESLRSQNVILNTGERGRNIKYLPYAFTQEGIAMLSSVLNSSQAVLANIAIMRTFVKLRELMGSHRDLAQKIESLERRYDGHSSLQGIVSPHGGCNSSWSLHPSKSVAVRVWR